MRERVLVTGFGIICSIGNNSAECFDSLINGCSNIRKMEILQSKLSDLYPVSEIKLSTPQLEQKANFNSKERLSRSAILGIIAANEAVKMANLTNNDLKECGLIGATTTAGIDLSDEFYEELANGIDTNKEVIQSLDCSDSTTRIANNLGIRHNITTISTACSSSANSIMLGARMIQHGYVKRVIVGGCDSLSRFSINGFNSLEILSKKGCKPFDKNRDGITPGEGAAFLVLEAESVVGKKNIYGEVKGFANCNEAFHQTATSPDGNGVTALINKALNSAKILPKQIDYINAHGTGTISNDISESNAIYNIFGENHPAFSSTKGYCGHTFAAAGAIEAVFSILALNNNIAFANYGFSESIEGAKIKPLTENKKISIRNVLSNSLGFGGCNTSLIFSKL